MEPERIPWPVRSIKQSWIDDEILNPIKKSWIDDRIWNLLNLLNLG